MLHTINPRLHSNDLSYIINDAQNKILCVDSMTWKAASDICKELPSVKHVIWIDDPTLMPAEHDFPSLLNYDNLVSSGNSDYQWPILDENSGCTICYTSGTTGRPKGVVYTHRANVLMTLSSTTKGFYGYPQTDGAAQSFLSLTGMFHANAWMMPFSAPLLGAKLILAGRDYAAEKLLELIHTGKATFAAGVPTILQSMVDYAQQHSKDFATLEKIVLAGSKPARTLVETLEKQFGIEVGQAWGMTEAQMGTMPVLKPGYNSLSFDEKLDIKTRGGLINYGVKIRLIDDDGNDVPFDGKTPGHFIVKGPWVLSRYLNHQDSDRIGYMTEDGWFKTGDISCIHPDGYMEIVDRSKDLIKSGGEWISSSIIESIVTSHPDVLESAVIGIPDPKWQERPLLIVVKKGGGKFEDNFFEDYLSGKIASWWIPKSVVYTDQLPKAGTGKIDKKQLREVYVTK